jgi:DNA-binding MarR family transcriptional regulator
MDEALRGLGLTTPQYAALSALEAEPGMSGAQLARWAFVTPQTMNGILTNLEGRALISRRPHPEHGRILMAFLTASGQESLREAHRAVVEIEESMLSGLTEGDRAQLATTLRQLADALQATSGERGQRAGS